MVIPVGYGVPRGCGPTPQYNGCTGLEVPGIFFQLGKVYLAIIIVNTR